MAGTAQKFEALDSRDASPVQGEESETQLDNHVLHRVITCHKLHEARVAIISWLLFDGDCDSGTYMFVKIFWGDPLASLFLIVYA